MSDDIKGLFKEQLEAIYGKTIPPGTIEKLIDGGLDLNAVQEMYEHKKLFKGLPTSEEFSNDLPTRAIGNKEIDEHITKLMNEGKINYSDCVARCAAAARQKVKNLIMDWYVVKDLIDYNYFQRGGLNNKKRRPSKRRKQSKRKSSNRKKQSKRKSSKRKSRRRKSRRPKRN